MVERLIDIFLPYNEIGTEGEPTRPGLPFLLKVAWVIEIYYLILNWGILQIHWFNVELSHIIPVHAQMINNIVLAQFASYYKMFIFLGIGLFFCGLIMSLYKDFPGFEYSPWMLVYSSYGIRLCPWLLILAITYFVYSISPNAFIILVILLPLIVQVLRKFTKR